MKVLKKGELSVNMHVTCPCCKSKLEIEPKDVKISLDQKAWYTCASCNISSYFSEDKLSEPMKFAILNLQNTFSINTDEILKNLMK